MLGLGLTERGSGPRGEVAQSSCTQKQINDFVMRFLVKLGVEGEIVAYQLFCEKVHEPRAISRS